MLTEFPFCRSLEGNPALQMIRRIAHLLDFEQGPWVAGGAIRRILTRADHDNYDIDVFFRNEEQMRALTPELRSIEAEVRAESAQKRGLMSRLFDLTCHAAKCAKEDMGDAHTGLKYERSNTLVPLQLINKFFFDSAQALIEDFDFTICQMVTDGRTVRCPDRSLNDLHEKRLRIATTSSGVRNVSRILRYFTYGFEPDDTVMKVVEACPLNSYYDPQGGGYIPFEPIIERLIADDIEHQIILSKVGDVFVERDRGVGVAYFYGYPFPAPLAFIFISCPDMRPYIDEKLTRLWRAKGLPPFDHNKALGISQTGFLDAYRQAYVEAGE